MPIRAERKHLYPKDWPAISARVRQRADQKCEFCGVKNGALGGRHEGQFYKARPLGEKLLRLEWPRPGEHAWCVGYNASTLRIIRIVLTVAHLNHDETDCRDENLKALCQRCNLTYDAKHHAKNAKATIRSRKALGDLFAVTREDNGNG